jgi:surface polysaccharide O-acyltransferase-like enzyme
VKWKVFSRACIVIFAVSTWKIFSTQEAALSKFNCFFIQNASDRVDEFLNVIANAYAVQALISVIFQAQPQQKNEFLFFHSRQLETVLA